MEDFVSNIMAMLFAFLIFVLIFTVFFIIVQWRINTKAGQPGWAVLVPFYGIFVHTQVIKRPEWWMVLYFLLLIPILGWIAVIIISIMDTIRLAKVFGKDDGFAVGLIFLPIVFLPILAFGESTYVEGPID